MGVWRGSEFVSALPYGSAIGLEHDETPGVHVRRFALPRSVSCRTAGVPEYIYIYWFSVGGSQDAVGVVNPPPGMHQKGTQRRPQRRSGRRLEEVAGGGYCRLQMPLKPALGVSGTVAGHRLGALEGGGGYLPPPSNASPPPPSPLLLSRV